MAGKQFTLGFILGLAMVFFLWPGAQTAQASCGAVSCSVVIGSHQQVPQEGMMTINSLHSDGFMVLVTPANDKTDELALTIPDSFRGKSEFGQTDVEAKSVAKVVIK